MEQGLILSLQFTAFDIEAEYDYVGYDYETYEYIYDYDSINYCYDHLTIIDNDGTTLMEKSCGNTFPADITSTSNIVKLVFKTDNAGTRSGWSVSWSAVIPGESQQYIWKIFQLLFPHHNC